MKNNFLKRQQERKAQRKLHQKAVRNLIGRYNEAVKSGGKNGDLDGWNEHRIEVRDNIEKKIEMDKRLSSEHYQRKLAGTWR